MVKYYNESKVPGTYSGARVALAKRLVKWGRPREGCNVVDIGCSVGLLTIALSKIGYKTYGVDFDEGALETAQKFNEAEGASAMFSCQDVSDLNVYGTIDVALCFDIFEHLHDDELGALLNNIKRKLSKDGCIVFHTNPGKYDYLFVDETFSKVRFPFWLQPFKYLSTKWFARIVKIAALKLDILYVLKSGMTYKERMKKDAHCNPLTRDHLQDILNRAGFYLEYMDTGFLDESQYTLKDKLHFRKHPITHRSIFGIAKLRT